MMKSVKSINPCKLVIQTIYDIVKAHGWEIKVERLLTRIKWIYGQKKLSYMWGLCQDKKKYKIMSQVISTSNPLSTLFVYMDL